MKKTLKTKEQLLREFWVEVNSNSLIKTIEGRLFFPRKFKTKEKLLKEGWKNDLLSDDLVKTINSLPHFIPEKYLGTDISLTSVEDDERYCEDFSGRFWLWELIEPLTDKLVYPPELKHECESVEIGISSVTYACKHCGRDMPQPKKKWMSI